jgi:hypothetical protein
MPSAAAQDVLQAILERRAAQKRREMAGVQDTPLSLPFSNRIASAFEAAQPVRQVDELSAPITLPFAARNQLGDWGPRMPNTLKALGPMIDPRTSPFSPAAVARLFMDPAGEAGRQVETGKQLVEPVTQFNDPNVDPVKQGADLGLAAMGGSSVVPAEANSLRMGIKAYHGSPHDFERFDSSKIGTGEGAQAYGHGLYFAEREGVAKEYRDTLSDAEWTVGGKPYDAKNPEHFAAAHLKEFASTDAAIKSLKRGIEHLRGINAEWAPPAIAQKQETLRLIKRGGLPTIDEKPLGKMYEVDIAADPEHFLDWDKPLSEQPEKVRRGYAQAVAGGDPIASELLDESPESLRMAGLFPNSSGAQAYNTLTQSRRRAWEKQHPGDVPASWEMAPWAQGASEQLREAGIPGIRYLDQGSRGAAPQAIAKLTDELLTVQGFAKAAKDPVQRAAFEKQAADLQSRISAARANEGLTSNYVVFDDRLISILRKYGLPISAAGLAALSQLHPQEAQAAQQQNLPRY